MLAISHISRERSKNSTEVAPMSGHKMLVLSLGTGAEKREEKYNAAKASKWGVLSWIFNNGNTPLVDIFSDASADVVDFLVSALFQSKNDHSNYLRIQVYT